MCQGDWPGHLSYEADPASTSKPSGASGRSDHPRRGQHRGDTYVVFVQADERYRNYGLHRKRPGLNHLAFWAESTAQVEALPDQLRARGVNVLYTDRAADAIGAPSSTSLFFEDPDRIKVEVISPEAE